MQMPVATGIQPVSRGNKAYVANIVSGRVSVINLNTNSHVKDIPVTLTPSAAGRSSTSSTRFRRRSSCP